jgi:effector-binding domain-containing protein
MTYEIQVREVPAGPLAVVKGRATKGNLGQQIRPLFDQVYAALKTSTVRQAGQNVILYDNISGENPAPAGEGFPIEVGVQVAAPFESEGDLICSATPAGVVATVVYMGPYDQMRKAYDALDRWCNDSGRKRAGPSWEIYGDWEEQPEKLHTDVFYLLKE